MKKQPTWGELKPFLESIWDPSELVDEHPVPVVKEEARLEVKFIPRRSYGKSKK